MAQQTPPPSSAAKASSNARSPVTPAWIDGHTSEISPAKPSPMPSQPRAGSGSPPGSSISISATISGITARTREESPLGIVFSA